MKDCRINPVAYAACVVAVMPLALWKAADLLAHATLASIAQSRFSWRLLYRGMGCSADEARRLSR